MKRLLWALAVLALLAPSARAGEAIRIGEINSYSTLAAFSENQKKGIELAIEELNAAGGVLGRPLEVLSRDDKADAGEGVRVAQELLDRDHVSVLMGTLYDHVKLAVSAVAAKRHVPFFCASGGTDRLIWEDGNPFVFRLDATTSVAMAIFADEAAKLPAKRWATIAPSLEYGKVMVESFKRELLKRRPDVTFVSEQWFTFGKLDAGAAVSALKAAKPEAIFSGVLQPDLPLFVRQGRARGLFAGKTVFGPWAGIQDYIEPLGREVPEGWLVSGTPVVGTGKPAMEAFVAAFQKKFGILPKDPALYGYITVKMLAAAIQKAGTLDPDKVAAAGHHLSVETPVGPVSYRAVDGQSTLGIWLGKTGLDKDGRAALLDPRYVDPASYFPSDDAVRAMRKTEGQK